MAFWMAHIPFEFVLDSGTVKEFQDNVNYLVDKTLELCGKYMSANGKTKLKNCKKRVLNLDDNYDLDDDCNDKLSNRIINTIYDVGDDDRIFFDGWDEKKDNFKLNI